MKFLSYFDLRKVFELRECNLSLYMLIGIIVRPLETFFLLIVNGLITENAKVEKTQKDTLILEYLDFLCKLTQ